jgi:hypothetical protein
MVAVVTFKGYNKMGVSTLRFVIIIYNIFPIHINIFTFVVKDDVFGFANVDRHLIGPEP